MARDSKGITPATHSRTLPAFTPQLQGITALWLVFIAATHGYQAELTWVTGYILRYIFRHPGHGHPHYGLHYGTPWANLAVQKN